MSTRTRPTSLPLYETPEQVRIRTWVQLVRTYSLIERRLVTILTTHELTLPQFDILATLHTQEGITQQELAGRLLVTKGNVCGILDRLEGLGWVERQPDPDDRRANRLHLTGLGRRKIESVFPAHDALVLRAFRTLPESAVKSLRATLQELECADEEAP